MTSLEIMLRHVLEGGTVKFDASKTCKFDSALASNQNVTQIFLNELDYHLFGDRNLRHLTMSFVRINKKFTF